jgi:nucleotide-binding universal stress UspA family protein
MTAFVVPFDGSELATAALVRASEYGAALDTDVSAVAVIPESKRYAAEKGWIEQGEEFVHREVVSRLHRQVAELTPEASFQSVRVDGDASPGAVANAIRRHAKEREAAVVFIGSGNAGRIVTSVTSVSRGVTADTNYDVHIVRKKRPPKIDRFDRRSDFYHPD